MDSFKQNNSTLSSFVSVSKKKPEKASGGTWRKARCSSMAAARCGVGGGGSGLLGVWSSHASHDAHTLIYRGINKDPRSLQIRRQQGAQCFHMQFKVAVLNAISQNYNFLKYN